MVNCTCGKTIDKIPSWLQGVEVEFVCNNCPNRQIKPISQLAAETAQATRNEVEDLAEMDTLDKEDEDE